MCARLELSAAGDDPYFVADLGTSILIMGDDRDAQRFRGYAILVCKQHVREPHDLDPPVRSAHLEELMRAGRAVAAAFSPCKLNYASFGNEVPHLHWHIIPRHEGDPNLYAQPWRHEDRFRDGLIGADDGRELVNRLRTHL